MTITYTRTHEVGTELIKVERTGGEVRETYTVDGEWCDEGLAYWSDNIPEVDDYMVRRDQELESEGYVKS